MSTFTPGPWGIEQTATDNWIGPLRPDGKVNFIVAHNERGVDYHPDASDRNDADARLIAASPELLAALTDLTAMCGRQTDFNDDGDGGMLERCRAAIEMATGDAP